MERKPVVVLVPDVLPWVLGIWARQIAAGNPELDCAIVPHDELAADPEAFRALAARADLVHCLSPWNWPAVERATEGLDVARIASMHHVVAPEDIDPLRDAPHLHAGSRAMRDELIAAGLPADRVTAVHCGVDSELFQESDVARARERRQLGPDDFAIGFCAKASSDDRGRKGIDVLFDAVERLAADCPREVHLLLTGPGWEERLAARRLEGVTVRALSFLPRSEMPSFFQALDVYLSTARVEGGPVPPFEALSCGTPIVSTPLGTVRDLVEDGREGRLVAVGDVDATVAALRELALDPERARAMGRAGRELVLRHLRWQDTSAAAGAMYRAVLGDRPLRTADPLRRDEIDARDLALLERAARDAKPAPKRRGLRGALAGLFGRAPR